MNQRSLGCAAVALAGALSFGYLPSGHAQVTDTPTTSDSQTWQSPRGYDMAYPENGTPNMVARQGYAAGFNQGQADAARGKKFKPTGSDSYDEAHIPKGMDKTAFKQQYRQAYVKGYGNGYKNP